MKKNQTNEDMIQSSEEVLQDAMIKLAAAQYVESEGNKLLEEEKLLNQMEKDELTEEDIKNFEKLCDREIKKHKRTSPGKILWFYRAAAVAAVLLLALNISIVTVPAMRGWVWDFITQINPDRTAIKSTESDVKEEVTRNEGIDRRIFDKEYGITYLPEGFNIASETKNSRGINIDYCDANGNVIFFSQKAEQGDVYVDTENATVSEIDINRYTAILSEKEEKITVYWQMEDYFIGIEGIGVDQQQMINVAKSVKEIK